MSATGLQSCACDSCNLLDEEFQLLPLCFQHVETLDTFDSFSGIAQQCGNMEMYIPKVKIICIPHHNVLHCHLETHQADIWKENVKIGSFVP
jgi:hypothetical protein